jgi:hypothetical protein
MLEAGRMGKKQRRHAGSWRVSRAFEKRLT